MKYIKLILIGLVVFILSGCGVYPNVLAHKNDVEGMKKYVASGKDYNKCYTTIGVTLDYCTTLRSAVASGSHEMVSYLLQIGVDIKDPKHQGYQRITRNNHDLGRELLTMAIANADRRMIKLLIDNDTPIDFSLDSVFFAYIDKSTSCNYRQSICDAQSFAKQYYYEKKQKDKQKVLDKNIEIKDNEADELLGI